MSDQILSPEEARAKRDQLMQEGYCVVPGLLEGEDLQRTQDFTNQFLDSHPVPHRFRFQGSDFPIINEQAVNNILSGKTQLGEDLERRPHFSPIADKLLEHPGLTQACAELGLENMSHHNSVLILSKPPQGPALYWHQDNMEWNHPKSGLPWPSKVFLSFYTVDTTPHNGCLRVIPGTHLRRIELHDLLPDAHGMELQDDKTTAAHKAFTDHPDAEDVAVSAGDLVIADGRVLHGAHPNNSDQRRPLLLQWWDVFPFPTVPTWWDDELPAELGVELQDEYEGTRNPTEFLKTGVS